MKIRENPKELLYLYPKLRIWVREFAQSDLMSNQRRLVGFAFILITMINTANRFRQGEAHWREYITLLVLSAMVLFWIYSAEYFSKLIDEQAYYFSDEVYLNQYNKYAMWIGKKETVPGWEWLYYGIWLLTAVIIYKFVIDLGIIKFGTGIQKLNAILLMLVLLASGNSVFSTIIFTYFLCDIYYADVRASAGSSNEEPLTNEEPLADAKSLTYNIFVPHMTLGIQKLLHDAQAHSTCYLAYALCFVIVLNVNVVDVHILMVDDKFRTILVFMGMICFGLYIVCTIGARYYIRKIVEKWRMEQLKNYQKIVDNWRAGKDCKDAIRDVPFSNVTGDWKLMESYTNRIDSLEKCKISLLPSYHEVLFTAAIGVFSKDIILYLFSLFANMV